MFTSPETPKIPVPRGWSPCIRSAVLHVISLAQYAMVYTRGWAANSVNARVRLKADKDQLCQEGAWLREEIRIKDARIIRIDPHRRPHYSPTERLAILELKAARGSSAADKRRVVTAKYPGHLWHVDLTTVPVSGFWCPWFPFALPQCWPFAWYLGFVEDHFSRCDMARSARTGAWP